MMTPLKGFIRKELSQTLRDPRMRSLLMIAPIIQMTLFGYALSTEVRNIRLAVYARPDDSVATSLQRRFLGTSWFQPVASPDPDPFKAVLSGQADAALVAPTGGFLAAINRGSLGQGKNGVQLLIDGTNSTRAQGIETYVNSILQAETAERTHVTPQPVGIDFSVRMLYNPSMETSYFMVPGILAMLLLLVTMVLTSSSITREKEMGTFETLIAAPVRRSEIILGKTVPYVLLGMLDIPLILGFARVVFGVPMSSPYWWWQLPLGGLVFVCSTVGIGTLISTIAATQQQGMMTGFFVTFPAQMLSGLMFPLDNMPPAIKMVSYLNPLRYFVSLMRSITLKDGDPQVFWMNVWPMALIAVVTVSVSFQRFRQKLN